MASRTPWIIALTLLIWALTATSISIYYYNQMMDASRKIIEMNRLIEDARNQMNNLTSKLMRIVEEAVRRGDLELMNSIEKLENETLKLHRIIGGVISVNILVDYGNGSRKWYNGTKIVMGESMIKALESIVKVKYSVYPFGVFIEAINDVYNDPNRLLYWMWWRWDSEKKMWILGEIACDRYIPINGEIFAWKYTNTAEWPPKPP
ncbi:MAG: hypothetical protein QXS19_06110 [Candidatus Methanomethylicia archaeon]